MRFVIHGWLFLSVFSFSVTANERPTSPGCGEIHDFIFSVLNAYQDRVDHASRDYQDADWLVQTADKNASTEKVSQFYAVLQKVTYDSKVLTETKALDDATKALDASTCPIKKKLSRAREILEANIIANPKVIEKEKANADGQEALMAKNNSFRISIPGESAPVSRAIYLKRLAETENAKARRNLFLKFNSARADRWLEWGFRNLVKARNEEARLDGFSNYVDYRYFRSQLDKQKYFALIEQVKHKLAPKLRREYQRLAKEQHLKRVEAWDLPFLTHQGSSPALDSALAKIPAEAPLEIAKSFYAGLGIDIDNLQFMRDLYPRAGKNTHAFTMGIVFPHVNENGELLKAPKPDIRFLANMKQPVTWSDTSTVIHELGHAVHAAYLRQPIGVFRDFGSVATEAIAMTMERMAASAEFIQSVIPHFVKLPPETLSSILTAELRGAKFKQAYMLVREVLFSDFENQMYLHPDADWRKEWVRLQRDYYGVDVPLASADWDVEHFLMAPIYVQNYAIGILMVEQIYASMLDEFHSSYHSVEMGNKLKSVYFGPGTEFSYEDLVQRFTGKPLSAEAALTLLD